MGGGGWRGWGRHGTRYNYDLKIQIKVGVGRGDCGDGEKDMALDIILDEEHLP